MKIYEVGRDAQAEINAALAPIETVDDKKLASIVGDIIADVRARGDVALLEYGQKFDSIDLTSLAVTETEFDEAYQAVSPELLDAIRTARDNITAFHRRQLRNSWMDMQDGRIVGQVIRPLDRVGIYAPSAKAPLASSVIMTAVPARVAGVTEIVLCCPARNDAKVFPAMLVAARECGVSSVFKIGGAQAIAAMAFGTDSVPKVDKVCGPGTAFVSEAKRQVFGHVGIDMLAGPSEILIIADETADPAYVAADFLSQAEHAEDSRAVLVTTSRPLVDKVLEDIRTQKLFSPRKDIIDKALDDFGVIIITKSIDEAVDLCNQFAPEHLEILTVNPWDVLPKIRHAGSIMMGAYTPVPLTDFAAGPNHVLPTNGTARFSSSLGVDDFIKKSSVTFFSRDELSKIAHTVEILADVEGLQAHGDTIRVRLNKNEVQ